MSSLGRALTSALLRKGDSLLCLLNIIDFDSYPSGISDNILDQLPSSVIHTHANWKAYKSIQVICHR